MQSIFFFKQKTAYEMRISDWSSDVCSSDLLPRGRQLRQPLPAPHREGDRRCRDDLRDRGRRDRPVRRPGQDRKSVVKGKSVSVRVDLGGRRIIKKKNTDKANTHHKSHNLYITK